MKNASIRTFCLATILNFCVNAICAGSTDSDPDRWLVSQAMIESEIKTTRKAKEEHAA